jgi:cation:H+ antiporter
MINFFILMISFIGLIWSASHLVSGGAGFAHYYRVPPLFIGLTIIAFGTTIPTVYFAIIEALAHQTDLVVNNAIGANIANIGLVLGLTILLCPPKIHLSLFKHGYPLLFLIMLLTYTLMLNEYFSVADGCLLLLATIGLICYLAYLTKHAMHSYLHVKSFKEAAQLKRSMKLNSISLFVGFIVIAISTHFFTQALAHFAHSLHIHDDMINFSLVSISISLPTLATCIVAALKNQDQLAVGTILGSNMYNLLFVLAFPGMIHPTAISPHIIWRDMPMMLALTFVIFLINYYSKRKMIRWHGGLLLLIYACYLAASIYNAIEPSLLTTP